jgi:Lrp/AsnC family leucine-responsive transcriptional regulator
VSTPSARVRKRLLEDVSHLGLDETDEALLRMLQADGRTTNAELARRLALSPPSVLQRVRKLEDSGVIQGYTAKLDPEKLGFALTVVAMVSLALHQDQPIHNFREKVSQFPEVLECLHVSGDYDFMLRIVARDVHDYERFVSERLSAIKGIGKIHSCFVLGVGKSTGELPI